MGTEVIQPQDCLAKKINVPRIVNPCKNYKHKSNKKWSRINKPYQNGTTYYSPRFAIRSPTSKSLMMRRGEKINSIHMHEIDPNENNYVFPMPRSESDDDCRAMYAGVSCAISPSPECLPLPSFSKKTEITTIDGSATKDLRRLLRLDENLEGDLGH